MFRFLVLVLALSAVAYGEERLPEGLEEILYEQDAEISAHEASPVRIIGGQNANINNVPWQVGLRLNGGHWCGATLISANWAVSAAHCTIGRSGTWSLLAGTANRLSGGQVRAVAQIIHHPLYNSRTYDNDINLLRPATPFVLGASVRPASLPAQGAGVNAGAYGIVSGWGHTREGGAGGIPTQLQQVWVPVVGQAQCNQLYWGAITGNMVCAGYLAGGRDACQGDSGGPFVINGQLIGVVSWGRGCARPNFPGVYARVSAYRNWLRQHSGV